MKKNVLLDVSPKEYKVMLALFEYRGATIDQLLEILGYNKNGITNMYKPIQTLTKLGYISAYAISPKRSKKIYYLSSKGYSKMLDQLNIPYKYIGQGFNKDYGDFPYDLYKPPNSLKLHHFHLVEFLIAANNFKKEELNNGNSFDFRDNRYASKDYLVEIENDGANPYTKTHHFRPDAEIRMRNNTYFVEIDLGTERGENLTNKFLGYRQYFEHLVASKQPLPAGIIFISEEMQTDVQKNRRWQLIAKRFLETLWEFAPTVNLIYESIDNSKKLLYKEYSAEDNRRDMLNNIKHYEKRDSTPVYALKEEHGFKWGKINFSENENKVFFLYEKVEGYETKGWARLIKYKEYMDTKYSVLLIPIIMYKDNPPVPLSYFSEPIDKRYLDRRYLFKGRGERGKWQTKDGITLQENPLKKPIEEYK